MQGIFVTFEGPDGGGKTTQAELLAEHLAEKGFDVLCTREPGGTDIGNTVRALLLDTANDGMDARTEALLYMAARAQHVAEKIRPALAAGKVVISDRYADSTFVYQGAARCLAMDELRQLNAFATAGLEPSLTLLLDAPAAELRGRMARRGIADRIEQEGLGFQERVRQGFLALAEAEPERIRIVPALGTTTAVQQRIMQIMDEFLDRRG